MDNFSVCVHARYIFGIVLLVVFPLIIIFMIVLGYAARAKADKQYEGFQRLSNHF